MGIHIINPNFNLEEAAEHKRLLNVERLAKENQTLKSDINSLSIALAEMLGGGE